VCIAASCEPRPCARHLESHVDQWSGHLIALDPNQRVDRDAERVGVLRRSSSQRARDRFGYLSGRSAARHALAGCVNAGDRLEPRASGSPAHELVEPLGDQVAK
jgi:hypothetical protein